LVLENWDSARKRGAKIYAELAGDGNSLSCYRITDSPPDGDGPIQAIQQALADARISADEIDYVNAHGTSTQMNDKSECAALRAVLQSRVEDVLVSSTKSCMGHLIAAAGAVVVVLVVVLGEVAQALKAMAPGETLEVLATDPGAIKDFAAFCRTTGHHLVDSSEAAGVLRFLIRKSGA